MAPARRLGSAASAAVEGGRRSRQGEDDRAPGDRRGGVAGSGDTLRTGAVQRVVTADLDVGGGEIGGESTTCLAETEHRDDRCAHGLNVVESTTLT